MECADVERAPRASVALSALRLFEAVTQPRRATGAGGVRHNTLDAADVRLTSDGRRPNCARKRLLKWDELLKPIE